MVGLLRSKLDLQTSRQIRRPRRHGINAEGRFAKAKSNSGFSKYTIGNGGIRVGQPAGMPLVRRNAKGALPLCSIGAVEFDDRDGESARSRSGAKLLTVGTGEAPVICQIAAQRKGLVSLDYSEVGTQLSRRGNRTGGDLYRIGGSGDSRGLVQETRARRWALHLSVRSDCGGNRHLLPSGVRQPNVRRRGASC